MTVSLTRWASNQRAVSAVLVEKYSDVPDDIRKHSVFQLRLPNHRCFLLRDGSAVAAAVDRGATSILTPSFD